MLNNGKNSTIQDVSVGESEVRLMKMDGFIGQPPSSSYFFIENVQVMNSMYSSYSETIVFSGFNYQYDAFIVMRNIVFENLDYQMTGSPIKFECFMKNDIEVHSSIIRNVFAPSFTIESKGTGVSTYSNNVKFVNLTSTNNHVMSTTLFQSKTGSNLKIEDSVFKNNFGYETASILLVSSSTANTTITN
jgi:hypothetical protein